MSIGTPVRAIDQEADASPTALADLDTVATPEEAVWDDEPQPIRSRRIWPVLAAVLAIGLIAGWTAMFAVSNRAALASGPPLAQWSEWLSQWSLPVLLVAVAWLIAMRSSSREASRFGDAARQLAEESAALELRLTTVNRELSLAREFLAAQSRELDYLGRAAAERISEHAGTLQALIADNGVQVEAIAGVSHTALANMTELRDNLPVVANSARDVTNQIGGAGRTAKQQLGELITGLERLNAFGEASERQVTSLQARVDTALGELTARIETLDAGNAARLAALRREGEAADAAQAERDTAALAALRDRAEALREAMTEAHEARMREEATSLAAMRGRIATFTQEAQEAAAAVRGGEREAMALFEAQTAALRDRLTQTIEEIAALDRKALEGAREKLAALANEADAVDARLSSRDEAFDARLAQRREQLEATEAASLAAIAQRADALEAALAPRYVAQATQIEALAAQGDTLRAQAVDIEAALGAIAERSAEAEAALGRGAHHFAATVADHGDRLSESERTLARLTDASVRLLELIQAAASHSRDDLPAALADFEARLGAAEDSSAAIRAALMDAHETGEGLTSALGEMHTAGGSALGDLDAYRERLALTVEAQASALTKVREDMNAIMHENDALAQGVAGALGAAVEQLRVASVAILAEFDDAHADRVTALAARIGSESAGAIDRALETRVAESIVQLDTATARSAHSANQTIAALRDQLARVHELTGNLEARAARAREQVEEQVDSDFGRRMALITESLNSHSIDIAKALSTEVTDIAWASYLKGDRGVFTRRAVKLVDGADARAISQLFESDHEFRNHVSRYIHDFEAMLRAMLSTRDGHALGVTLLSSDMGKLYVTLAQAIERLRE